MRLWSLHPKYLDGKGLVALWRETLLAQACLAGKTKGYTMHPQLDRFKQTSAPLEAIGAYLSVIADEADRRGYKFNRSKIISVGDVQLTVTTGQVSYERKHLAKKLVRRDIIKFLENYNAGESEEIHPLFTLKEGPIESWEKI